MTINTTLTEYDSEYHSFSFTFEFKIEELSIIVNISEPSLYTLENWYKLCEAIMNEENYALSSENHQSPIYCDGSHIIFELTDKDDFTFRLPLNKIKM